MLLEAPEHCARQVAEGLQAPLDPLAPGGAAAQSEAVAVAPARGEGIPRDEADALPERGVEEVSARERPGQLEPQHEAAVRPAHSGAARERAVDGAHHPLDVVPERATDSPQVAI